jgi:hypothetical protein
MWLCLLLTRDSLLSCTCDPNLPTNAGLPALPSPAYLRNNTAIYTAKGVEVVPIVDGCQTNGKIVFHDSCVDKPTPDNFTCAEQRAFGKCEFPFMVSPAAAQWKGGFCQRTCQRCDCSGEQCSFSQLNDMDASNGVIHSIDRVLFPPPMFTKEDAIRQAITFNASVGRSGFACIRMDRSFLDYFDRVPSLPFSLPGLPASFQGLATCALLKRQRQACDLLLALCQTYRAMLWAMPAV